MSALFELPLSSETLTPDEVAAITGCTRRGDQIAWLEAAGWTHVRNKAGEPVIGRLYVRLRLAGISPAALVSTGGWAPDFSNLR
jgi:hypothetical protein